jgi:hypothetical protein
MLLGFAAFVTVNIAPFRNRIQGQAEVSGSLDLGALRNLDACP